MFSDRRSAYEARQRDSIGGVGRLTQAVTSMGLRRTSGHSVMVPLAVIPTTAPVTRGTLRLWIFNASDAKIDSGRAWLQYSTSLTNPTRKVNGRWFLSLCEQDEYGKFTQLTAPVQVIDPRARPFSMGSPTTRMTVGRPVFIQIDYEAASPSASEVVFWKDADALNVTVNLE